MDTYPPKFSKVLLTPDPHYIPGYGGYCPQLKYHMGKSYGQLTAELLTSPQVKPSSRLMISGVPHSAEAASSEIGRSIPDWHVREMIPGYTGFIPKSRSHFACTYSEMCHRALTEYYHEQQKRRQQQSAKLPVIANYTSQQFERPSPPLRAINSVVSYKPSVAFIPVEKPYFMDDNNPHKYFIPGFTGHVPKTRFLNGKGYSITTNLALIQFGRQQHNEPIFQDTLRYKFLYGQTFGQLSQNALEKSGVKRAAKA